MKWIHYILWHITTALSLIKQNVQWHVQTTLHFLPGAHCAGTTTAPGGLIIFFTHRYFLSKHSLLMYLFIVSYINVKTELERFCLHIHTFNSEDFKTGVRKTIYPMFLLTEMWLQIFWYERWQWSGVRWKEYTSSSPCLLPPPLPPPPPVRAWRRSSIYFSLATPISSASFVTSSSETEHKDILIIFA